MDLRWVVLAAALALGGCAGFVRDRIYKPEPIVAAPAWPGEPPREVSVRTSDGLTLRGYYWAPAAGKTDILVFFHGNGGNRDTAARVAAPLHENGHGLLIADYRGYSGNPGRPSEQGLIADGNAFLDLARQLQPDANVYLFGWSMGGAVALELAAREPVDGVVTLGAFTRLTDVAPGIARPFLPDRFDNLAAIGRVRAPLLLLLHGTEDRIVPYAHAERLRDAAGGRAVLVTLRGAGHHLDFRVVAPLVWTELEARRPRIEATPQP